MANGVGGSHGVGGVSHDRGCVVGGSVGGSHGVGRVSNDRGCVVGGGVRADQGSLDSNLQRKKQNVSSG